MVVNKWYYISIEYTSPPCISRHPRKLNSSIARPAHYQLAIKKMHVLCY
jgi:hypothetical protein